MKLIGNSLKGAGKLGKLVYQTVRQSPDADLFLMGTLFMAFREERDLILSLGSGLVSAK
tara:strand:+ start:8766 stop:8942 length:177 start_codon:yes stop_codon:yes gene_type:complete